MGELHGKPVETRSILENQLGFALYVVENGEKGSERIGDGVRGAMLHEGNKHFEPMVVKKRSLILEQETKSPILDSKPELAFPSPTCLDIVSVSCEGIVIVPRGEFGHVEVELNLLQQIPPGEGRRVQEEERAWPRCRMAPEEAH